MRLNRLLRWIAYLGFANFFVFVLAAMAIGGSAMSGAEKNGHFFIGDHGHLREVGRGLYSYSLWHARSLLVTQPLAVICGFLGTRDQAPSVPRA